MGLSVEHISAGVAIAHRRMQTLEQELNAADAKLGDGDTGTMLARLFDGLARAPLADGSDVGAALISLATAAAGTTGSSLGTLVAIALRTIGKATAGQADLEWSDLGGLLAAAAAAMLARGGARLGDKTVVDALQAVAQATTAISEPVEIRRRASAAASASLEAFRGRPCRMGRARMYPEESARADDPGMLAFVRLTEAVCRD
jgi:hypothetical protein